MKPESHGAAIDENGPIICKKLSGAYFTPAEVAATLTRWSIRNSSDRLLDPSCGDGQFLALHRNSVGIEQNPQSAQAAMSAAPWALVHEGDFFAWAAATPEQFECAAGNPPFIRYQSFAGDLRRRALELCALRGAAFNGLTSSWAPFLVATATLLKPGGRLAFVVPAEIGHAPYAAPLLEYLVSNFAKVHVVAVREKLFPALSEDCWLLYADRYRETASHIDLTVWDRFRPTSNCPRPTIRVNLSEWRSIWSRRLRPYLLPSEARRTYANALLDPSSRRLSDVADVGIGYVSGDNDFFHLRPSEARRLKIPSRFLQPSIRNARALPPREITRSTVAAWHRSDDPILLLRLSRGQDLPESVVDYLESSEGKNARLGYKCRNRTPWYAVPDVQIPDFVMSYMSGRSVGLVRNKAGVACTNSLHCVRVRDKRIGNELLTLWNLPLVRLSCELEGHALGGGMLKLEPREAGRVLLPSKNSIDTSPNEAIDDGIRTMQRWRHYE